MSGRIRFKNESHHPVTLLSTPSLHLPREVEIEASAESQIHQTFAIVIPAYNEERRIVPVLDELTSLIKSQKLPWTIIISVDGNDGTEGIVREASKAYPFVKVSVSLGRNGKGTAIKRVTCMVDSEFIILMDADRSVTISEIVGHLERMDSTDVIIFSRYSGGLSEIPLRRRILSRGFNALVRLLLRIDVRDTQSGYKVLRTSYFRNAISRVDCSNAFYDVSLLYHLKLLGARIEEIPVKYKHREDGKFHAGLLTLSLGLNLLAFRVRHSRFYPYIPETFACYYRRVFKWV